ncbi:MAG TPA: FG-GAP-like repeat-containing protein, partial [Thermoanaerobaculia bacterium]|nr:FG-GAP-like repeat-containing protein [Thermoanaerobaculia bacterium]
MRKGLSRSLVYSLLIAAAAPLSAGLFAPPGVQPAYLGSLPQNPPMPDAGVSGSFNSNVDPYPDLAVVNYGNSLLLIYTANPIGTLSLTHTYGIFNLDTPKAIAAGDVNGDGKLDLVVGDVGGLSILLGDGNGNFAAASPQRPAGLAPAWIDGVTKIFLKDLNHDGRLDIVAVKDDPGGFFENGELHLVVLLGTGGGQFGPPDDYDLDAEFTIGSTMFALDDFDGDGQPDVMFDDSTSIKFMKGHSNGKFDDPAVARDLLNSGLLAARTAEARDMDGDGKIDFVAASSDALFWCRGNGNGTLQAPIKISDLSADFSDPYHMLLIDVDKDGRPDIVVAGAVWLQGSNHVFTYAESVGSSFNINPLASADLNEDTRPDLVMQGPDPNTIAVYLSTSGPATHVQVTGGNNQSTTINTAFPQTLSLKVLDANNVGVKNLQVTFSPPGGFGAGANVNPGITFTDPTGVATDTATANGTIGCYTVNATVQGFADPIPYDLCNLAPDHM